eukprot:GHVU01032082.1.p1 GENE.GHVU01032082.1~~GHVU01032082.1.p1  ORF type:complete len:121 (+),score=6.44 GHVU01032082.1:574-936(+)
MNDTAWGKQHCTHIAAVGAAPSTAASIRSPMHPRRSGQIYPACISSTAWTCNMETISNLTHPHTAVAAATLPATYTISYLASSEASGNIDSKYLWKYNFPEFRYGTQVPPAPLPHHIFMK